jgi:Gluconate 2-dehydrogenase subunit 3
MARIIPTDDQPGAREAGTIDFLDRYLSGLGFIYAKPDGSGFEKLQGKRADAWKQRIDIIRAKYVEGIMELDRRCQSQFGAEFLRLTTEQQDRILDSMEHPALKNEAGADEAKSPAPALQLKRVLFLLIGTSGSRSALILHFMAPREPTVGVQRSAGIVDFALEILRLPFSFEQALPLEALFQTWFGNSIRF